MDVVIRDGACEKEGWDQKYLPGHAMQVKVKVRGPAKEHAPLFLVFSLLQDAQHLNHSGHVRAYPLTKGPAEEYVFPNDQSLMETNGDSDIPLLCYSFNLSAYKMVIHTPGFAGQYSLKLIFYDLPSANSCSIVGMSS